MNNNNKHYNVELMFNIFIYDYSTIEGNKMYNIIILKIRRL